jgi:signal transduction histidine kinase
MTTSTESIPPSSPSQAPRGGGRVRRILARAAAAGSPRAGPLPGILSDLRPPAIALAVVGVAAGAGLVVPDVGSDVPPFVTVYPAVAAAAWAGGFRAGLIATILGAFVAGFLFMDPPFLAGSYALLPMLIFAFGGVLISVLGGHLHRARARAEAAAHRAEFLADASRILSSSLDPLDTVESLARIAVPRFADWCAIDLADDQGNPAVTRIAHPDPAMVALGYRLRRDFPIDPGGNQGVPAVIRTGRSEYIADMPAELLASIPEPELREIMAGLDLRSYLCVPLVSPRGTLGALSAFMSGSGRRFTPEDLALAEDLGRRTGTALDHARLFRRLGVRSRELDEVIASIRDGVIVADERGRVRSRNAAADRILGGEAPADLDDAMRRLIPDGAVPEVFRSPVTGRAARVSTVDVDSDGERSLILLLRDVTEILDTEAARNAFIGMLSHELRTPVTTIYGNAAVLQRESSTSIDREDLIADLAAESDRLYRLVEDLLVLSRFERGALEVSPEPVLVQRIVPAIARLEARRSPGLDVRLEVEPDLPAVEGDETYIGQVVRNLLSNAAKYGGTPGRVILRASARDRNVILEVEDEGPGIPEGEQERIFDLYERGPAASRMGAPGAGVGLFVTRRLIELMRGTIVAGRGERGGARFTVTLPAYEADLTADEPVSSLRA